MAVVAADQVPAWYVTTSDVRFNPSFDNFSVGISSLSKSFTSGFTAGTGGGFSGGGGGEGRGGGGAG